MKKFLLLISLFSFAALGTVQAQCPHSKGAAATEVSAESGDYTAVAAKAAEMDESIEARVDAEEGKTAYFRKNVCAKSGKVSYEEVEWCTKSGKFINVSPSEKGHCNKGTAQKASMKSGKKDGCCSKGVSKGKSCCAGKASKASCSGKASKTSSVKKAEAIKVKATAEEN